MSPTIEIQSKVPKVEKIYELKLPLVTHKHPTEYGEVSLKYKHKKHKKSVTVEVAGLEGIPTTNVNISYKKKTSKANIAGSANQMKVTLSEREIEYLKRV
jgi:hypothetical protein